MLEDFSIGNSQCFSITAQPTPLIRLNWFNSLHLFCWLVLYLEWTLIKQTTYMLLSVSPAVTAPWLLPSLVLPCPWWCLSASEVSICLCVSPGNLDVGRTVRNCWKESRMIQLRSEWTGLFSRSLKSWVAACSEPSNSTVAFTKRKDLGMLLPGVLAMLKWDWVV